MCVLFLNTCSNALLHMQKGGLAITQTTIKCISSNPVSSIAGFMNKHTALKVLTPPAFERTWLQVGVCKWTG